MFGPAEMTLTAKQAAVWKRTVDAMPPEWFGGESLPLLAEYCRHVTRSRLLASRQDVDEIPVYDKLAAAAERETRAMLACARALRLTHQSRYDAAKARRKAREPSGPRPWEFGRA